MTGETRFEEVVADLRSPRMGTELMGPLLAALVRSTRPERILEVGAGATTLFLLRALAEVERDVAREREQLPAKQRWYEPGWEDDPEAAGAANPGGVLRWLEAQPALGNPDWYDRPYCPGLVSIDDDRSPYSVSTRVAQAAAALGLARLLDRRHLDFRKASEALAEQRFQLAWFDCGGAPEYQAFLDGCWDLIEPDGGLLVMHYTLTVPRHEAVIDRLARDRQSGKRGRFEILSLLEPHKLMQNSCTLIRRCEADAPVYPITRPISLERTAR